MSVAGGGDAAVLDVLDHGGLGARRHWVRGAAVAGGLLVLCLVGLHADRQARSSEFDQVTTRCHAGHSDYVYAVHQVDAMDRYAAPLLLRPDAPAAVKAGMAATVRAVATAGADSLAPDLGALAAVSILPWHDSLLQARSACQDYLGEARSRLRRAAADLSTLDLPTGYLGVRQRSARAALVAAAVDSSSVLDATQVFGGTATR